MVARGAVLLAVLFASGLDAARVEQGLSVSQKARGNSMIAKVIEMLGEEKDKISADISAEGKTMAEYTQWCDDTQTEHSYAIKSAKSKIEDLSATITDNGAQIVALDEELGELGNEIAARQKEVDEANSIREKEREEFVKAEAEQVAMVAELEKMEVELKKQIAAFEETPPPVVEGEEAPALNQVGSTFDALLQTSQTVKKTDVNFATLAKAMTKMVDSVWVDPESKRNLALLDQNGALIQQDPAAEVPIDDSNDANLAAFEGLKGKAEESLQRQRDEENKKQSDHNINDMTLKQAIALAENNVDDAKKERARLAEEKSKAEGELAEVQTALAADEKGLEECTHECNEAAASWDHRQKEAAAEQAAIEKAKEILSSRVTVFLQAKVTAEPMSLAGDGLKSRLRLQKTRQGLVKHFRNLGNHLHSLAMLNLVSVATSDPMAQVKGLLNDLIAKLEKEAAEAASLHQFCEEEKTKTSEAMEKKNMVIEKLSTRIEKASTTKQELEESIATLTEEIAAMEKANAEATKIRGEEHTNYVKVDTDFRGAAEAVDDAIDALKEYYGDASLLQTHTEVDTVQGDSAPPSFGGAKSDSAGGIVGMLETMGEEFRKTVKENESDERERVKAFEKMIQENKVSTAAKDAEIKASESQVKSLSVSLEETGGDLKVAGEEKGAIEEYIEKLKPQCEGRTVPYAERKAKREAEIQGLKEGLAIIEADSPAGAMTFLQVNQHVQ